jgi:hypothetical protein
MNQFKVILYVGIVQTHLKILFETFVPWFALYIVNVKL